MDAKLIDAICDAIDDYVAEHQELTIAQVEEAFLSILDAMHDAADEIGRKHRFGNNVVPFVQ